MDEPAHPSLDTAIAIARLLDEHKCADTAVLDLAGVCAVADYFVITTVRSSSHLTGLMREVARGLKERGVKPLNMHKRASASGWLLVDCGDVVVHLMEREQRDFYDLERLWFRAGRVFYSSKSM